MNRLFLYIVIFISCFATAQVDYGYCIDGEDIVFTFNVTDYKKVTIDNTEVQLELGDINIRNVTVAGSFNKWSGKGWQLVKKDEYVYELRKRVRDLNADSGASFKFLVNDKFWVEPPAFANNKKRVNLNDLFTEVYNLELNAGQISDTGNHTFYLKGFNRARKVIVAGTFNNWNEQDYRMKRVDDHWELVVQLPAGDHQYRYIVDGNWMEDPHNNNRTPNEHNEFNSVISKMKTHYFMLKDKNYKEVYLAGDFSDWQHGKIAMRKEGKYWVGNVTMSYGAHHYKYIIDGDWTIDPGNRLTEYGEHGHLNSVVFVK